MKNNIETTKLKKLTIISLFCALAYLCTFLFHIKVLFLSFDLKDAVMAIGAMYFGPLSAIFMSAIVSLIEFLTISDTGVYGLIMNFLSSASFCIVASLIYKYNKKLSGAITALVCAVLSMTAVMMCANIFITPYFMTMMNPDSPTTSADVIRMIPTLLLPFNASKATFNAALVMLLYKPVSNVMKSVKIEQGKSKGQTESALQKPTVISRLLVTVVSVVIIIAVLLFLFLHMHASVAL